MKKKYYSPSLQIDRFQLREHLAASTAALSELDNFGSWNDSWGDNGSNLSGTLDYGID